MLSHVIDRCFSRPAKRRSAFDKDSSSYCKLEPRHLLTTLVSPEVVASYSTDFGSAKFSYLTNDGALHQEDTSFVPISSSDDPFLRLQINGGHPGLGITNGRAITHDRFAIVSYKVQESGYYEITDSFLRLSDQRSGGVEFRVFVNDDAALYSAVANDSGQFYFDTRIGFVAQGDQIRIAFGSDADAVFDRFKTDFSITRFAGREQTVGGYRADFDLENNGDNSNWRYLWNAPSNSDLSTGGLENPANYQPLSLTANLKRVPVASGDNSAGHLILGRNGGHPGQGYSGSSTSQDRYAIAAFEIEHSGFYGISDSFLELTANSSDGLEVVIGTSANDSLVRKTFTSSESVKGFDVSLGSLSKGDTIYVAFGARGEHVRDNFKTDFSIVRILPREAPLRSIDVSAENVIYAADFGAIANDRIDDHAAISAAIAAAVAIEGPVKLQFTSGIYNIDQLSVSKTALFVINGRDDFVLDGQGAQFFVSNPSASFLHIVDSERVVLENFAVDYVERYSEGLTPADDVYRVITFSQGTIEQVDTSNNSILLSVDPSVSVTPSEEFFENSANPSGTGYALDSDVAGRSKSGSQQRYLPIYGREIPSLGQHRIFLADFEGLAVGDRFILQRRGPYNVVGIFQGSNQVTLSNVRAFSSPATFVSATRSTHVNILNSHALIKSGRWKSINADAVHIQDNRESVWVEDSRFAGVGDDISNLYSLPSTILDIIAPDELDLATVNFDSLTRSYEQRYLPGDKVLFYDPIAGSVIREARVVSSEIVFGGAKANFQPVSRVKFDQPINGVVVANSDDGNVLGYRNDIQVFNRDLSKNGLIQNSKLANSRRYGTFLMAENVQIVDSKFSGLQDAAIAAHNQTSWPLGNIPRDILVQNNDFNLNGFGDDYSNDANIRAVVSFKLDRYPDLLVEEHAPLISNLRIVDNRFRLWGKTALSVRNAQNVTISGNEFYINNNAIASDSDSLSAIEVAFTTDASVDNSILLETTRTNPDNFIASFSNIDAVFESPSVL